MWGLGYDHVGWLLHTATKKTLELKCYQLAVAPTLKKKEKESLVGIIHHCRLIYELNHGCSDNAFFCTRSVGLETFDSDLMREHITVLHLRHAHFDQFCELRKHAVCQLLAPTPTPTPTPGPAVGAAIKKKQKQLAIQENKIWGTGAGGGALVCL